MWLENTTRLEFNNSSNFRPGDTGVHGYGRGWDISMPVISIGRAIEEFINANWTYDPERPEKKVAVLHDTGSGWHLHLQTHDRTQLNGGYR